MRVRQEFVLRNLASPGRNLGLEVLGKCASPERKLGLESGTETGIEAADCPGFVVTECLVKPADSC